MFKKKNRKYILAHGCSFTDAEFESPIHPEVDCSFPKWPQLLGDKLGVEVMNIAHCGYGNDQIEKELISQILKEKPWMVVVGLTEVPRFRIYGSHNLGVLPSILAGPRKSDQIWPDAQDQVDHMELLRPWHQWYWDKCDDVERSNHFRVMMEDHFNRIIRIQNLCKALNIKLIMTHLLQMINHYSYYKLRNENSPTQHYSQIEKAISWARNHDQVDPTTIIGWPHFESINDGYYLINGFDQQGWSNEPMFVGEKDEHPNHLGHQHIAEKFYEHYQKIYS